MRGFIFIWKQDRCTTAEAIPAGLPPAALRRIQRSLRLVDLAAIAVVAARYYEFAEVLLEHDVGERPEPEQEPEPFGDTLNHHGVGHE